VIAELKLGRLHKRQVGGLFALEASTLNPRGPVEKESYKRSEQPDAGPIKPIPHTEPPQNIRAHSTARTLLRKVVLRKPPLPEELLAKR
jgi:hypothetical protein